MSDNPDLRSWDAEDLLVLARAAGMLWNDVGRDDVFDTLSQQQRELLDRASTSYLTAAPGVGADTQEFSIKLDVTKPLDMATELSGAAWRAKSADGRTWVNDEFGHIAAVVSEDLVKHALRHGYGL